MFVLMDLCVMLSFDGFGDFVVWFNWFVCFWVELGCCFGVLIGGGLSCFICFGVCFGFVFRLVC